MNISVLLSLLAVAVAASAVEESAGSTTASAFEASELPTITSALPSGSTPASPTTESASLVSTPTVFSEPAKSVPVVEPPDSSTSSRESEVKCDPEVGQCHDASTVSSSSVSLEGNVGVSAGPPTESSVSSTSEAPSNRSDSEVKTDGESSTLTSNGKSTSADGTPSPVDSTTTLSRAVDRPLDNPAERIIYIAIPVNCQSSPSSGYYNPYMLYQRQGDFLRPADNFQRPTYPWSSGSPVPGQSFDRNTLDNLYLGSRQQGMPYIHHGIERPSFPRGSFPASSSPGFAPFQSFPPASTPGYNPASSVPSASPPMYYPLNFHNPPSSSFHPAYTSSASPHSSAPSSLFSPSAHFAPASPSQFSYVAAPTSSSSDLASPAPVSQPQQ